MHKCIVILDFIGRLFQVGQSDNVTMITLIGKKITRVLKTPEKIINTITHILQIPRLPYTTAVSQSSY